MATALPSFTRQSWGGWFGFEIEKCFLRLIDQNWQFQLPPKYICFYDVADGDDRGSM